MPPDPAQATVEAILEGRPAVRLFRDRARAADPRFDVTADNAADIARICRALEGVPLAIELAAARIRALTPAAMLGRLDRVLPLLVTSARDVPGAAAHDPGRPSSGASTSSAPTLVRCSCASACSRATSLPRSRGGGHRGRTVGVGPARHAPRTRRRQPAPRHGDADVPLFSMLVPSARDRGSALRARSGCRGGAPSARGALRGWRSRWRPLLRGTTQVSALERLEAERDNLRAAFRHLFAIGEVDAVADAVWRLILYWWIRGYLPEAKTWTEEVPRRRPAASPTRTRAIALVFPSWVRSGRRMPRSTPRTWSGASSSSARRARVQRGPGTLTVLSLAYMSVEPADLELAEQLTARTPRAGGLCSVTRRSTRSSSGRSAVFACSSGTLARDGAPRGRPARRVRVPATSSRRASRSRRSGWAPAAGAGRPDPDPFLRNLELALRLGSDVGVAFALEGLGRAAVQTGRSAARRGAPRRGGEPAHAHGTLGPARAFITPSSRTWMRCSRARRRAEFEAARARSSDATTGRPQPGARPGGRAAHGERLDDIGGSPLPPPIRSAGLPRRPRAQLAHGASTRVHPVVEGAVLMTRRPLAAASARPTSACACS